jgi:hypothetical protein
LLFTLPETKGIPLEEMGRIFGDENEIAMYEAESPKELKEKLDEIKSHGAGQERDLRAENGGHIKAEEPSPVEQA